MSYYRFCFLLRGNSIRLVPDSPFSPSPCPVQCPGAQRPRFTAQPLPWYKRTTYGIVLLQHVKSLAWHAYMSPHALGLIAYQLLAATKLSTTLDLKAAFGSKAAHPPFFLKGN